MPGHSEPRITLTDRKCWLESIAVILETEKAKRIRFDKTVDTRIQV